MTGDSALFTAGLYCSLAVFGAGMVFRISRWFRHGVGPDMKKAGTLQRITASVKGAFATVSGPGILVLLKILLLDVVLQRRVFRQDLSRWIMHFFIYAGFTLLVLMHALHRVLADAVFSNYNSTLNPFMFLRDLFGAMVIIGIAIAVSRRFVIRVPRLSSGGADIYLIIIISVIMFTGIFLEGLKITSYRRYREMASDYSAAGDEKESMALEAYWVREFGVISPRMEPAFDRETLELGKRLHGDSCAGCHSKPEWAFAGFVTAAVIRPAARRMDEAGMTGFLYLIHCFACFIALAYLPFSKMFHLVATPLSLIINGVMEGKRAGPASRLTRQAIEADACVHCCACSFRCSARTAGISLGNDLVLPSEKMGAVKKLFRRKDLNMEEMFTLEEGAYICTSCDRCTVACPAGIDLKGLWFAVKEELIQGDYPLAFIMSPLSFSRGLDRDSIEEDDYPRPHEKAMELLTAEFASARSMDRTVPVGGPLESVSGLPGAEEWSFSYCFSCSTCTSSCPVVQNYDSPARTLGLLPHQVVHSLVLGLNDLAMGSSMIWQCLTCYRCQENCPQGVPVTDIFFMVKNMASARLRRLYEKSEGAGVFR